MAAISVCPPPPISLSDHCIRLTKGPGNCQGSCVPPHPQHQPGPDGHPSTHSSHPTEHGGDPSQPPPGKPQWRGRVSNPRKTPAAVHSAPKQSPGRVPAAGFHPPAQTRQEAGSAGGASRPLDSPPHAGQAHRGEMERSSPPWADPTAGLPPALPALPTLPACPDWAVLIPRAAPVKNRRRALSRADFPLFLLKIIFKNLK